MFGMAGHVVRQCPLQRRDATEVDVLVDLAQLRAERRRRDHVAGLPAGDVVGLAERADHEGARIQLVVGQHAGMGDTVEHQVLVDLVADQVDIPVANQRGQAVQFLAVDQRAAGVVRGIDDDQPGTRPDGLGHALPVDGEVRQRQRHVHATPAGELHGGFVAVVGRVEYHHFVARMDQRLDRAEDRLGRPRRDGHLAVGTHPASIELLDLLRHLLAQGRQAGHRRVLVVPGGDMPAYRLAQLRRAVEIGKALGEVDRATLGGQLRHAGEDGGADIRQLALNHRDFLQRLAGRQPGQTGGRAG